MRTLLLFFGKGFFCVRYETSQLQEREGETDGWLVAVCGCPHSLKDQTVGGRSTTGGLGCLLFWLPSLCVHVLAVQGKGYNYLCNGHMGRSRDITLGKGNTVCA